VSPDEPPREDLDPGATGGAAAACQRRILRRGPRASENDPHENGSNEHGARENDSNDDGPRQDDSNDDGAAAGRDAGNVADGRDATNAVEDRITPTASSRPCP
jgi:hypothetical protein